MKNKMDRENRIYSARETLDCYKRKKQSVVAISTLVKTLPMESTKVPRQTNISVVKGDVIDCVFELFKTGKTGVLNFASATNPGGGYLGGANAQEETLCRCSFLGPELMKFIDSYYKKNRANNNFGLYSNNLIYSQNVAFIKRNISGLERFLPEKELVLADIVTIAAPNLNILDKTQVSRKEYLVALATKIQLTLRAFKSAGCENLVLGAFGCGVFKNSPKTVANLFQVILNTKEFKNAFSEINFAIFNEGENLKEFKKVFGSN